MNAQSLTTPMVSGCDPMPAHLATQLHQAPLHLASVGTKAVALAVDGGRLSSDAGVVLLKDLDTPLGLTHTLAAVLSEPRDPRRSHFPLEDLLKQRVFHIAAGYEDANDATTLRDAPLFKLRRDRLPESGAPVASQPTISRCENRVARPELSRMALELLPQLLASYATPPQGIVLAVDDTEAPVHGQQAQARYDGYDGGDCFLPFHGYEGLSGRLSTPMLKAKRFTGAQMLAVLKRLVQRLRHAWPDPLLILRGDRHFASPEVMQWVEAQPGLRYVTGVTRNAVLKALAREAVEQATRASARWGRKVPRFHATRYQAQTWSRPRRVGITVEVSEQGVNTRFVVTAREHARTKVLSQKISWARGPAANARKAHQLDLKSDRTSWHRFEAHQFRVLLHAAADGLLETLRREVLRTTQWASATRETIQ
jgi:Transposase DDE domain group 1